MCRCFTIFCADLDQSLHLMTLKSELKVFLSAVKQNHHIFTSCQSVSELITEEVKPWFSFCLWVRHVPVLVYETASCEFVSRLKCVKDARVFIFQAVSPCRRSDRDVRHIKQLLIREERGS